MKNKEEKELVCKILGMEFYASKDRAMLLRSDIKEFLISKLTPSEMKDIKIKPAFDCTPTFTKIKNKIIPKSEEDME